MPEVYLKNRGVYALVGEEDLPLLSGHTWHARGTPDRHYAATGLVTPEGRETKLRMHRLIRGAGPGQLVDHANGNGLDNRRVNLRLRNSAENSRTGDDPSCWRREARPRTAGNEGALVRMMGVP